MKDYFVEFMHDLEKRLTGERQVLKTGLVDLDKNISLRKGQVILVGGRPGMGKTSLLLSIAANLSRQDKNICMSFVPNESSHNITVRLMSQFSRIPIKRLNKNKITDNDWPKLAEAGDHIVHFKMTIESEINEQAEVVFIEGPTEPINLKKLEDKLVFISIPIPVWPETRPNHRPMIRDIAPEYAYLVDRADSLIFIYRDEFYNRDSEDVGIGELIIAKNRIGEQDTIRAAFISDYLMWTNYK